MNKCCIECAHFEERTSFCRLNPPTVVTIYEEIDNKLEMKIKSMFPTIYRPDVDYCNHYDSIRL